jgi:hypothetical protein
MKIDPIRTKTAKNKSSSKAAFVDFKASNWLAMDTGF